MRRKTQILAGSCLAPVMALMMSATMRAQQITVAGSGSGAFEAAAVNGPVNNGAVAWASCTFDRDAQTITCSSRVYNIVDLTLGHLHSGGPGSSGPVMLPIPNLPLHISGSWGQTWTWTAADLVPNPASGLTSFDNLVQACVAGNCYMNWHTTASPGGAVRAQLCPKSRGDNTVNAIAVCFQQGQ